MSAQGRLTPEDISNRWPHIGRFLRLDDSTGSVDDDHPRFWRVEDRLAPAERAAAYEEWAEFYEWRLEQRSDELATGRVKRHLVAEWTESIAYSCRRSAAFARGEDPGVSMPLSVRRPDLDAERQAIVAEIIAELDSHDQLAMTG
jgi:hypothetical protein